MTSGRGHYRLWSEPRTIAALQSRRERAVDAVAALRRAGATGISLLEVHAVGYGEDAYFFGHTEDVFTRYHLAVIKLEVICPETQTDGLVDILRKAAHTGERGDGMIFVTEVSRAIRIRDGAAGDQVL